LEKSHEYSEVELQAAACTIVPGTFRPFSSYYKDGAAGWKSQDITKFKTMAKDLRDLSLGWDGIIGKFSPWTTLTRANLSK